MANLRKNSLGIKFGVETKNPHISARVSILISYIKNRIY